MKHIIIDTETLGTKAGAPILAIGAVAVCDKSLEVLSTFDITFDMSQYDYDSDYTISASTVEWWLAQSDEARTAVLSGTERPGEALDLFHDWFDAVVDDGNQRVWTLGHMDIEVLEFALETEGNYIPWEHRDVRCLRTRFEDMEIDWKQHLTGDDNTKGVSHAHTALGDAMGEAMGFIDSEHRRRMALA